MNEITGDLLSCTDCGHKIGMHDGSGCGEQHCRCSNTMEAVLQQNISVEVKHFKDSFAF